MVLESDFYARGGATIARFPLAPETPAITDADFAESKGWIKRLSSELALRAPGYQKADDYVHGRQGDRFTASRYRPEYGRVFHNYRENVCATVVETVDQRLDVDGFRFPAAAGENVAATDPAAWKIWQDNLLDARSQIAHTEALVKGVVYVLISPFAGERIGGSPRITIEDPCTTIVATDPGSGDRVVGMKAWDDELAKRRLVTLYYPDRIEKWQAQGSYRDSAGRYTVSVGEAVKFTPNDKGWEPRQVAGEPWPLENQLGVVPLVPLVNRPRLGRGMFGAIDGESEIEQIMPIQDAINEIAMDGLVAADKAAFPQKWATGIEVPIDPDTNKPITTWKPDIEGIMATAATDAKFGNFAAVTLEQYDQAIAGKLKRVAIIAQLPFRLVVEQRGQPASGEAEEAAETGFTKKIERKQRVFGEGWEEIQRLAFRQLGDATRADDRSAEAYWRPASIEATAAKIDGLVKMVAAGGLNVPLEVAWERAGFSATERAAFPKMLARQAALLDVLRPAEPAPAEMPPPQIMPAAEPPAAFDFTAFGAWLLEAMTEIARGMAPNVSVAPAQTTIGPGAVQVTVQAPPTPKPTRSRLERDAQGRAVALVQE